MMLKAAAYAGHDEKNTLLLRATLVFWLFAKLIGWRMFTLNRVFPSAPIFESFDQLAPSIHLILFILSLLLIVLLFVFVKNKTLLYALLAVEILLCLLDQNRWQPWEYQYFFIIFIFVINAGNQKLLAAAFTFILAATYIYSGAGKLNDGFLQTIWLKMVLHLFLKIDTKTAMQHWLYYSGYILGPVEILAGVGLLFFKTQKMAAWVLIIMHLFILLLLGPFGLRYNIIVWPWNVAMIMYLYLIFLKDGQIPGPFKLIFSGWNKVVFICWGILPALNFVGCWDSYLSSGIYSGKLPRMLICIKDTSKCKTLQRFTRKDMTHICNGQAVIDLQYWAMAETKVAPYPEIRVYKEIQQKLAKQFPDAGLSFVYFINGRQQ